MERREAFLRLVSSVYKVFQVSDRKKDDIVMDLFNSPFSDFLYRDEYIKALSYLYDNANNIIFSSNEPLFDIPLQKLVNFLKSAKPISFEILFYDSEKTLTKYYFLGFFVITYNILDLNISKEMWYEIFKLKINPEVLLKYLFGEGKRKDEILYNLLSEAGLQSILTQGNLEKIDLSGRFDILESDIEKGKLAVLLKVFFILKFDDVKETVKREVKNAIREASKEYLKEYKEGKEKLEEENESEEEKEEKSEKGNEEENENEFGDIEKEVKEEELPSFSFSDLCLLSYIQNKSEKIYKKVLSNKDYFIKVKEKIVKNLQNLNKEDFDIKGLLDLIRIKENKTKGRVVCNNENCVLNGEIDCILEIDKEDFNNNFNSMREFVDFVMPFLIYLSVKDKVDEDYKNIIFKIFLHNPTLRIFILTTLFEKSLSKKILLGNKKILKEKDIYIRLKGNKYKYKEDKVRKKIYVKIEEEIFCKFKLG